MPEILIFYLAGLGICTLVALAFYFLLGEQVGALASRVLGQRTGILWGRSFRMLMFMVVLVGGLSTQWYGCGYEDYKSLAADRHLMFQRSTQQVSGSISYGRSFLLLAAGVSAITIGLLARRGKRPDGKSEGASKSRSLHG